MSLDRLKPTAEQSELLRDIWEKQAPDRGPLVDYSDPAMPVPLSVTINPVPPADVIDSFQALWPWTDWVRLYAKPPQAVLAASRLAAAQGRPKGVAWMAPGTGRALSSPGGDPGVAVLRCDWAPDQAAIQRSVREAGAGNMMLVVDESATGLRLAKGGASAALGLEPDMVLWSPSLPGGRTLGLLAGKGQAPPEPDKEPSAESREVASQILDLAVRDDLPAYLYELGVNLAMGLNYMADRAGLSDEVKLAGPLTMPRLEGRRVWAFMALALEERLKLAPLLMLDLGLDWEDSQELVWPRLARACARLKVLPEGEMAPLGWREAGPSTCHAVKDILTSLED
ncbi:MAG: hypothetical protein K9K66_09275 [Desulfarculaceae bacterium]|nr:hypothetical protein [Desulfarculaceae bacterium]MCF8073077.1 hypothetical protein [Desulfarculaceae bacterium]MCF8101838.1 hypothetical protein [Desulfarculaceae bacterium]MCF8115365.1 hypothetical protein [Desulfarculaceae bacterium]